MAHVGRNKAKGHWYNQISLRNHEGRHVRIGLPFCGKLSKGKPNRKHSAAETKLLNLLQDIERCFAAGLVPTEATVPALVGTAPLVIQKLQAKGILEQTSGDEERLFGLRAFFDFCLEREEQRTTAREDSITIDTYRKYKNTRDLAVAFFSDRNITDIREITEDHADEYRSHRLAIRKPTTVQSEIKYLRTVFFKKAVKRRLLSFNPFADCKVSVIRSQITDRRETIAAQVLKEVEDSISNFNWKLYWCLLRWTGARASEPMKLKWRGVDFENDLIVMPSPKTAKKGMPERTMPLYDELKPILEKAFEQQQRPSPSSYVVRDILNLPSTNREATTRPAKNAGTDIKRFIKKAGFEPWPKPLQNLRVTREDELLSSGEYSKKAVHAFIGHSAEVYQNNYESNLTADDFIPRSKRHTDAEVKNNMETVS